MVGGGKPLLHEIFSQPAPINAKSSPSEKSSVNINRKFTMCFPMSLRLSPYVVSKPLPPLQGEQKEQKRKTAVFRLKSHFASRESATKFLCMKTVSDKVVRHSLAKNDWWGRPVLSEILGQTDRVLAISPIFRSVFARSASAVTPSEKKFNEH